MSEEKKTKVKLYYTIHNCGDGSASVQFHDDEETGQLAVDIEEEGGEPFCENYVHSITLVFNEQGKLLNPSATKEELRRELAERRGEEFEEEEDETPPPSKPSAPKL